MAVALVLVDLGSPTAFDRCRNTVVCPVERIEQLVRVVHDPGVNAQCTSEPVGPMPSCALERHYPELLHGCQKPWPSLMVVGGRVTIPRQTVDPQTWFAWTGGAAVAPAVTVPLVWSFHRVSLLGLSRSPTSQHGSGRSEPCSGEDRNQHRLVQLVKQPLPDLAAARLDPALHAVGTV